MDPAGASRPRRHLEVPAAVAIRYRDLHSRWRRVGEWRVDRYHPESRTKEKRRTLYSPDSSGAFCSSHNLTAPSSTMHGGRLLRGSARFHQISLRATASEPENRP